MPTKRKLEQRLQVILAEDGPAPQALVKTCREWLLRSDNRDGRGAKSAVIKDASLVCGRFQQALRHREHHVSSSISREARKSVTAALHQSYPDMRTRLKRLNGRISQAGKNLADKRRKASETAIGLDHQFELKAIRAVASLESVGHALRNCVAHRGVASQYLSNYHVWVLRDREEQRPLFLLTVDRETREVRQIEGQDGSTPRLEYNLACQIINALGISGDDERAFAKVGAYRILAENPGAHPALELTEARGYRHRIWVLPGHSGMEMVISTQKRPGAPEHWSWFSRLHQRRLRFAKGLWNHLSKGDLSGLMVDHPSFAAELHRLISKKRLDAAASAPDVSSTKVAHA